MKYVKSTVTYKVPHWNYCNVDRFDLDATPSKQLCRFCLKTKEGYRCMLYDQSLMADHGQVRKTPQCCKTAAGFESVIEEPEAPTLNPRTLMKQTIELYSKTVKQLIDQGYPRSMAEAAAKKFILDDK